MDELKKKGFYVLRTDDGDRYLREVYANDELVCIEGNESKAYIELGKQLALSDNHQEG